nr:MAG TPA: hypothetical protein [Caudoviricetes sp.]
MTFQQRKDEIFQQLKNAQMIDRYNRQKNEQNNDNLATKIMNTSRQVNDTYNAINDANNLINKFKSPVPSSILNNPMNNNMSNIGQYGLNNQTFQNSGELASKIGATNIGGTANSATQATGAMSKMGGVLQNAGKAMPVVGALSGGASAVNNFANGNNIDGALDLAKTGAMFIPGVGWAISGAIQIAQMLKGAKEKADQKAMMKSQEEAYKSQQLAENETDKTKEGLEQTRQSNLENMQSQLQQPQSNDQITQDLLAQYKNQELPQNDTDNLQSDNIGMPTGYASNIQPDYKQENAPALDYSGSANQELDNNEVQKQSIMNLFKSLGNTVSNGVRDFSEGYQDNSQHGFMEGDLYNGLANNEVTPSQTEDGTVTGGASELKKTLMNRVGELAGTGARVMANPWTQAGIAALATKATGGDWADALNNAYSYGTAKATSNYYDRQLNPDKAPSALSRFTKDDYNANTLSRYRDTMADNNSMRVKADLDKNMPTLGDWYNTLLYTGEMSLDDYNKAITAPDYNPTARINIAGYKAVNDKNYKQDSNNIKRTQVNNNFALGKEKNAIARTNANTNAGRLASYNSHNGAMEKATQDRLDFDKQKWEADQKAKKQKELDEAIASGTKVKMRAPNNKIIVVDSYDVKEAKKQGCKVVY